MAYATIKQNNQQDRYYTEYVCDSMADLASLPKQPICSTGSVALIINPEREDEEGAIVYMLNSKGKWVEI